MNNKQHKTRAITHSSKPMLNNKILVNSVVISLCTLTLQATAKTPENVIAKTLYAECRSEGPIGIQMVATVIYNRGVGDYDNCVEACLKPKQFSCWNNKKDIKTPTVTKFNSKSKWTDSQAWAFCLEVEAEIKNKTFKPIGNWNHYAVNSCKAKWFKQMSNKKTFKNHTFGYI